MYTLSKEVDPWQPHMKHLSDFFNQNDVQHDVLLKTSAMPAIHTLAKECVLRFEIDVEIPHDCTTPAAPTVHLCDLLEDDHPMKAVLSDRERHVVFMTDMVVQDASNTLPIEVGLQSNLLMLSMWHVTENSSAGIDGDLMRTKRIMEEGMLMIVAGDQTHAEKSQTLFQASISNRHDILEYGGTLVNMVDNLTRLSNGIVTLPEYPLNTSAIRVEDDVVSHRWAALETNHKIYSFVDTQKVVQQKNAVLECLPSDDRHLSGLINLMETAHGLSFTKEEREALSLEDAMALFVPLAWPLEEEVPYTIAILSPGTEIDANRMQCSAAIVPQAVVGHLHHQAEHVLFSRIPHETLFDGAYVKIIPNGGTWSELLAQVRGSRADAGTESRDSDHVRITLEVRITYFDRALLANAVPRVYIPPSSQ